MASENGMAVGYRDSGFGKEANQISSLLFQLLFQNLLFTKGIKTVLPRKHLEAPPIVLSQTQLTERLRQAGDGSGREAG